MKVTIETVLPVMLIFSALVLAFVSDHYKSASLEFLLVIISVSTVLYFLTKKHSSSESCSYKVDSKFSSSLINSSPDAIIVVDHGFLIQKFNPSAVKLFEYSEEEVFNQSILNLIANSVSKEKFLEFITFCKDDNKYSMQPVSHSLHTKEGVELQTAIRLTILNDGDKSQYIFHVQDKSAQLAVEDKLFHATYNDNLTGLPNKTVATQHIHRGIEDAQRDERNLIVMKIGLDRFKHINESMSHEFGDQLLINVGKRLQDDMRRGDLVSRLNGDQFIVTLVDINKTTNIDSLVRKYVDVFVAPFIVEEKEIHISASIGIACYPDDAFTVEALLRNAESAMFLAKTKGGVNFRYYSQELREKSKDRLHLENELRSAIVKNQLEVLYQPQVDLRTGKIIGVEALIRWTHPDLGAVSPVKFIPVAEEIGLISEIGQWVMKRACTDMIMIHREREEILSLSINLSAYQFLDVDLVEKISEILNETRFPCTSLELEITESLFMEDVDDVVKTLNILSEQGIAISMDDFGTGYSSLSYLKRFPINTIKVDRSFVKDITSDQDNASIVTATIQMAHSLSLDIVAEGVETEEQLRFLIQNKCDKMQGFYFSKPLSFKALNNLLQENRLIELNSDKICLISGYR